MLHFSIILVFQVFQTWINSIHTENNLIQTFESQIKKNVTPEFELISQMRIKEVLRVK